MPFHVKRRVIRKVCDDLVPEEDLKKWALQVGITLGDQIPTWADRYKVLRLVY